MGPSKDRREDAADVRRQARARLAVAKEEADRRARAAERREQEAAKKKGGKS